MLNCLSKLRAHTRLHVSGAKFFFVLTCFNKCVAVRTFHVCGLISVPHMTILTTKKNSKKIDFFFEERFYPQICSSMKFRVFDHVRQLHAIFSLSRNGVRNANFMKLVKTKSLDDPERQNKFFSKISDQLLDTIQNRLLSACCIISQCDNDSGRCVCDTG